MKTGLIILFLAVVLGKMTTMAVAALPLLAVAGVLSILFSLPRCST